MSFSAEAAVISGIQGDVYVNRGAGYQQVEGFAELYAGDSVMAGSAGYAIVDYGGGCVIQLAPGAVVAIGELSPCALETGSNAPPPGGLDASTLGMGALVVGGIAGAAILLSGGDDSKPASGE